jgi:hypothetical protein
MNKILSVLSDFAVKFFNREGAKYAKKYGSYLRHVAWRTATNVAAPLGLRSASNR